MIVTVLGALLLSDPHAEENRDGFRDPPLPSHPIPHRPGGYSQPGGPGHLAKPETLKRGAQLLGGHGHGAIKVGTTYLHLASRHIMPTFSAWPFVLSRHRKNTFARPSTCSASSTTN